MLLEIVTHVYAMELPDYAADLVYHLSSLVLHKPTKCNVLMTIYATEQDWRAREVIDWFDGGRGELGLDVRFQPPLVLGRRCIGRNQAALDSKADLVWFADGDFAFGPGCLDTLAELPWPSGASMIFPQTVLISKDHQTGDWAAMKAVEPKLIDIDPSEYVPTRYKIAIGGIQIAHGDDCRKWGYLQYGKPGWMTPMKKKPFKDTLDDKAYRGYISEKVGGKPVPIELPNLYRIRQTRNARQ